MKGRRRLALQIAEAIGWRLGRLGVQIELFFMVREGGLTANLPPPREDFSFVRLSPTDLQDILGLDSTEQQVKVLARFNDAKDLCFGLRDGSRLVAKVWCSLSWLSHLPVQRALGNREAYLYAAYTDPLYRGRQLAPLLRSGCYRAMQELGRTDLLSYTVYCNTASRRFKAKLGAVEESLHVSVRLFRKWSRTWKLRTYPTG